MFTFTRAQSSSVKGRRQGFRPSLSGVQYLEDRALLSTVTIGPISTLTLAAVSPAVLTPSTSATTTVTTLYVTVGGLSSGQGSLSYAAQHATAGQTINIQAGLQISSNASIGIAPGVKMLDNGAKLTATAKLTVPVLVLNGTASQPVTVQGLTVSGNVQNNGAGTLQGCSIYGNVNSTQTGTALNITANSFIQGSINIQMTDTATATAAFVFSNSVAHCTSNGFTIQALNQSGVKSLANVSMTGSTITTPTFNCTGMCNVNLIGTSLFAVNTIKIDVAGTVSLGGSSLTTGSNGSITIYAGDTSGTGKWTTGGSSGGSGGSGSIGIITGTGGGGGVITIGGGTISL